MTRGAFESSFPLLARRASFEAHRLIRLGWFQPDEEDDLIQKLLLHLWRKRQIIGDGDDTGRAYANAVLRNRAKDLIRYEYAPLRDRRKRDPLHDDADAENRRLSPRTLIDEPDHGLRIDVHRVVAGLPPAKQWFAWLLADRGLVAAAEATGISRSTASRWKVEIRELFQRYGVGPAGRPARQDRAI